MYATDSTHHLRYVKSKWNEKKNKHLWRIAKCKLPTLLYTHARTAHIDISHRHTLLIVGTSNCVWVFFSFRDQFQFWISGSGSNMYRNSYNSNKWWLACMHFHIFYKYCCGMKIYSSVEQYFFGLKMMNCWYIMKFNHMPFAFVCSFSCFIIGNTVASAGVVFIKLHTNTHNEYCKKSTVRISFCTINCVTYAINWVFLRFFEGFSTILHLHTTAAG